MRLLAAAAVLLTLCIPATAQMPQVPGLECTQKLVALYEAGPNFGQFSQFATAHLDFLRAQFRQGTLTLGGPFLGGKSGGLIVLNVSDLKQAESVIQQDALVANKVVTYSLRQWAACKAASVPPPTK
jgi:uncharacterized protein YciI